MSFLLPIISLIGGGVLAVVAANWLVKGAAAIAKKLNISDLVVGLTIVAFGTSAPEFSIGVIAAAKGNTAIAIGNVLGSNIGNILLILGLSAVVAPLAIHKNTQWKEIPLCLLAGFAVAITANDILLNGSPDNTISRSDGCLLLLFFSIFIYYTFQIARQADPTEEITATVQPLPLFQSVVYILIGLVGLFFGGDFLVNGAVAIAQHLGISETIIGLTIVAIGTSLPELATSVVAAMQKKADIVIGNIIGSNLFNTFMVLGSSAVVAPLPMNKELNFDLLVNLVATLLLFIFTYFSAQSTIKREHGVVMLLLYSIYLLYLVLQV